MMLVLLRHLAPGEADLPEHPPGWSVTVLDAPGTGTVPTGPDLAAALDYLRSRWDFDRAPGDRDYAVPRD